MKLKNIFASALMLFALGSSSARMSGQTTGPAVASTAENPAASGARVREFQGDDIDQVLRLLARQAKVDLVMADGINGKISMRLENKTAMDAIEIIVRANKLSLTKDEKGVYYVDFLAASNTVKAEDDVDKTEPKETGEEAAGKVLDYLAKPETVSRIAKYKRNLYTALLKEGFSAEQAAQIVASDHTATEIIDQL